MRPLIQLLLGILLSAPLTGAAQTAPVQDASTQDSAQDTAVLTTGVRITVAAGENVPGQLVLVAQLPGGAVYLPGSAQLDSRPFARVRQSQLPRGAGQNEVNALLFTLPVGAEEVAFDLAHREPLTRSVESSLVVLTPKPQLLRGQGNAVALYNQSTPVRRVAEPRARVGAAILSPLGGTVVQSGSTVAVTADTVLGGGAQLFVSGVRVGDDRLGQRTLDNSAGRETFEYIGVALEPGPNRLRFESTPPAGTVGTGATGGANGRVNERVLVDELTVFLAGPPETVTLTPVGPLGADTATPLRFDVRVLDAFGKAPADGYVTFEVKGASFGGRDASAQGAGYQVRYENGSGTLVLAPLGTPGEVEVEAKIGRLSFDNTFVVGSSLRPWILAALGSAEASYQPGQPLAFDASASLFARGSVGDYLVTVAGQTTPTAFGLDRDPFSPFPVVGGANGVNTETPSRQNVYARVERDLSFVQYGNFETGLNGLLFSDFDAYTGLSARYAPLEQGLVARAYAALSPSGDRVSLELASDGTSVYRLPGAPIRAGSLRLEVVKRRDFDNSLIEDDPEDPLMGRLQALLDYALDDATGAVQLVRPLPLQDGDGNRYLLRATYTVLRPIVGENLWQYGGQVEQAFGAYGLRAGARQETTAPGTFVRLVSGGLTFDSRELEGAPGRLEADLEVTYGQNQESSGVGFAAETRYEGADAGASVGYEYLSEGYRSDAITEAAPSHTARVAGDVDVTETLSASLETQLSYPLIGDAEPLFAAELLGSYEAASPLKLGGADFATPAAQLGAEYLSSGVRLVGGLGLRDLQPLAGGEIAALHRHDLGGGDTMTDFSVSYRLTDFLSLRFTDQLTWGESNRLFVGFDSSFEHSDALGVFCASDCGELGDLGRTSLLAQYEIPERVSSEVSRLRFGLRTRYPVTEGLSLEGSLEQVLELGDAPGRDEPAPDAPAPDVPDPDPSDPGEIPTEIPDAPTDVTVFGVGAIYDRQDYDLDFRYELGVAPAGTKHTLSAGSAFAFSDALFGSLRLTFLSDSAETPGVGLSLNASGAYRGDTFSVLSDHEARIGTLSSAEDDEDFFGDTLLTLPLGRSQRHPADLRVGYAYRYRPNYGFQDRASLGGSVGLWTGGSVLAYARLFYDRPAELYVPGATLELSQRVGCGLYLAGGYNLLGRACTGGDRFGQHGVFVRLDAAVDETWRCGPVGFGAPEAETAETPDTETSETETLETDIPETRAEETP